MGNLIGGGLTVEATSPRHRRREVISLAALCFANGGAVVSKLEKRSEGAPHWRRSDALVAYTVHQDLSPGYYCGHNFRGSS